MADARAGSVASEQVSGDAGVMRVWHGDARYSVANATWLAGWLAARVVRCVVAVSVEARVREKAE